MKNLNNFEISLVAGGNTSYYLDCYLNEEHTGAKLTLSPVVVEKNYTNSYLTDSKSVKSIMSFLGFAIRDYYEHVGTYPKERHPESPYFCNVIEYTAPNTKEL